MEIILPSKKPNIPVHPWKIFCQGHQLLKANVAQLSMIYAAVNLPLTLLAWLPQIRALEGQKSGLAVWAWLLFVVAASSWGHIALLLGIQKAQAGQAYSVWQSINRAQGFLIKYLALLACVMLFFAGLLITAGISAALVIQFLTRINIILTLVLCCLVIVAVICLGVYYSLRWSLAALICVYENRWPLPALRASLNLLKQYINPLTGVYGIILLLYILGLAPVLVAEYLLGDRAETVFAQKAVTLYLFLLNIILVPLWNCVTVVLFNKLKTIMETHVHAQR